MQALSRISNKDIQNLDVFDLDFLRRTGRVRLVSEQKMVSIAIKSAKDTQLWGPEARLMAAIIEKAWFAEMGGMHEKLAKTIDVEAGTFNHKKFKALLTANKKKPAKVAKAVEKKVQALALAIAGRSVSHFQKQKDTAEKKKVAKADFTLPDWEYFEFKAMSPNVDKWIKTAPFGAMRSEGKRLGDLVVKRGSLIDKRFLEERMQLFSGMQARKGIAQVADVQAGKAWAVSGMRLAQVHNVQTYRIVGESDSRQCSVCANLDGKTFDVAKTYEKMMSGVEGGFPRIEDVDNKSPEDLKKEIDTAPPFHPRCRCDLEFAWEATTVDVPTAGVKKIPFVKAKDVYVKGKDLYG